MAESATTEGRRPRRSARISRQLEEARRRNVQQLAEQRERERRVEGALREFVEAGDAIAMERAACEDRIAVLRRKMEVKQEESEAAVAGERDRQARAALEIHEAGRTVEQVADLLELSGEKEARRLIAAGRRTGDADAGGQREDNDAGDANSEERADSAGPELGAGGETTGLEAAGTPWPQAVEDGRVATAGP
ncbi:hypothetical protein LZ318_30760 [Saccharopolyspora indica]|uniref:hypothetical protein n=1 Tax=Saccharopolyspora indica TaxID=1229659 RepID=UPI0022EA53B8|nr:hypothetical protein [Saccharopolyspora indica]MDA3644386.1 hypothetical protein [Saccharopolyspora indica]